MASRIAHDLETERAISPSQPPTLASRAATTLSQWYARKLLAPGDWFSTISRLPWRQSRGRASGIPPTVPPFERFQRRVCRGRGPTRTTLQDGACYGALRQRGDHGGLLDCRPAHRDRPPLYESALLGTALRRIDALARLQRTTLPLSHWPRSYGWPSKRRVVSPGVLRGGTLPSSKGGLAAAVVVVERYANGVGLVAWRACSVPTPDVQGQTRSRTCSQEKPGPTAERRTRSPSSYSPCCIKRSRTKSTVALDMFP